MSTVITKIELNRYLFSLLGRIELVDRWWQSENLGFGGKTPDSVYQTGPEGRQQVRDYILKFCNGDYS